MNSPAIKEMFTENKNIILVENNGKELANSILELAKNKEKKNELGENARKLANIEFSEDKIAEKLIAIIKRIQTKKGT